MSIESPDPVPPQPYLSKWDARIITLQNEVFQLRAALDESVKLQSHYAGLLNMYDGGKRMLFADREAWMERLAALTTTRGAPR